MKLEEIFSDKTVKQKAKTELVGNLLTSKKLSCKELMAFAESSKDKEKASCMEAMEFATRQDPTVADATWLKYTTQKLTEEAPRVKWESAKVIGNIAHLFPAKLSSAIGNLLVNAKSDGTVVRWSSAFALGEILKLKTKYNKDLLPVIQDLCDIEKDTGIKKKYLDAIKQTSQLP